MATLDDLLNEADHIIEKRASVKKEEPICGETIDSATADLAEMLFNNDEVLSESVTGHKKVAKVISKEMTPFEKVAHAMAICETVQLMSDMEKLGEFVKIAKSNGYNDEQIEKFVADRSLAPVHRYLDIPERLMNE